MPQVDISVFLPIIINLVIISFICYSILLVFIFYPFISKIKLFFNFFSKVRFIKEIIINAF